MSECLVRQDTRRPCQGTTDRGFEPLLTESESAVLPLHQSASSPANKLYYNSFSAKINPFFQFFLFFLNFFLNAPKPAIPAVFHAYASGQPFSSSFSSCPLTVSSALAISLIISHTERKLIVLSLSIHVIRPCQLLF